MAKRLPRPNLLRGLIRRRIVGDDKATVALINAKLDNPTTYRALNDYYSTNQGSRWINRFKVWTDWLWKHREAILRIVGLVIMFADDGTPVLRDAAEVEAEKQKSKPKSKPKSKVTIETVHGVKDNVEVTQPESPLDN